MPIAAKNLGANVISELLKQISVPNTESYEAHNVTLYRDSSGGFGFSVTGDDPVSVRGVRARGPGDPFFGLAAGDIILKVPSN